MICCVKSILYCSVFDGLSRFIITFVIFRTHLIFFSTALVVSMCTFLFPNPYGMIHELVSVPYYFSIYNTK